LAWSLYYTKSGWRCIGRYPPALALNLHNPQAKGKQGPITEEIYQTLPTKKEARKSGHAANIINPTQTRCNREKYTFCVIESFEHLKNLKTGRVSFLGLELTILLWERIKNYKF
jgi:hypothetical protein